LVKARLLAGFIVTIVPLVRKLVCTEPTQCNVTSDKDGDCSPHRADPSGEIRAVFEVVHSLTPQSHAQMAWPRWSAFAVLKLLDLLKILVVKNQVYT
jgi:hypothetical protein